MKKSLFILLPLLVLAAGAAALGYMLYRDTAPPELSVALESDYISPDKDIALKLRDPDSGLRAVAVRIVQEGKETELLKKDYSGGPLEVSETFRIPRGAIKEGQLELIVEAKDASFARFGNGCKTEFRRTLALDTKPPRIAPLTSIHNMNQGGCGLALFELSEDCAQAGVQVGDRFFPAHKQPDGSYACLFAMPWNVPPASFNPLIRARDLAGNERTQTFPYHANAKKFKNDAIEVSDHFLDAVMPQFEDLFPGQPDKLQLFLKVNGELRRANDATLLEVGRNTSPTMLWKGVFLRLPNGAPRAGFADTRDYMAQGKHVDTQTHLGLDLASLIHSPVPAANSGKVVFADNLGIYGSAVVIDHGLGLQTLYAHLSQIQVKVGESVEKGQVIGVTGSTGLALGDHLHYGVLVAGQPVTPIEWFDPSWIANNITSKLKPAS